MIVDSDSEVQRFAAFARLLTLAMRRDIEPETHVLSLGMIADGKKADAIRGEIIEIVKAWQRGRLAPRSVAPLLLGLYELLGAYDELGFPGLATGAAGGSRHLIPLTTSARRHGSRPEATGKFPPRRLFA